MKIYLLKDVEKVGMAGEIISVADGYGANFLVARKLGIQVTPANETELRARQKVIEQRSQVVATKSSMLAERIKGLKLTLKRTIHDSDKLYGSVSEHEVVDLLAEQGVSVSKNQVIFEKSIKTKGSYPVTIKLSSTLKPIITLQVIAAASAK